MKSGFTLLEVVVGMALLILVLGAVFSVSGGAIDLSTQVDELRKMEARYTKLSTFLRTSFNQLPANGEVWLSKNGDLVVSNGGAVFSRFDGDVVFRYVEDRFEMAQFAGDVEISKITLLRNVASLRWELSDESPRPAFLRMKYRMENERRERGDVFRIPRYAPTGLSANRNEATST